jgi:hypothetical protein
LAARSTTDLFAIGHNNLRATFFPSIFDSADPLRQNLVINLSVRPAQFRHGYLITAFRHIAYGGDAHELRGWARTAVHLVRIIAVLNILVFFADTINADILFAAIIGNVQFQDNPLILDSASDSTSVAPTILRPHINYFEAAKYAGGTTRLSVVPRFLGTTIIEDVDSPSVLDGETTAILTYNIRSYAPMEEALPPASAPTSLDRTITFGCLQI